MKTPTAILLTLLLSAPLRAAGRPPQAPAPPQAPPAADACPCGTNCACAPFGNCGGSDCPGAGLGNGRAARTGVPPKTLPGHQWRVFRDGDATQVWLAVNGRWAGTYSVQDGYYRSRDASGNFGPREAPPIRAPIMALTVADSDCEVWSADGTAIYWGQGQDPEARAAPARQFRQTGYYAPPPVFLPRAAFGVNCGPGG